MVNFLRTHELPHHDHSHVEGVEEVDLSATSAALTVREVIQPEEQPDQPRKEDKS